MQSASTLEFERLTPPPSAEPAVERLTPARHLAPAPSGTLFFDSGSSRRPELWSVGADGQDLHRFARGVMWPSVSRDGERIAYTERRSGNVVVTDRHGQELAVLPRELAKRVPARLSPDGRRLLVGGPESWLLTDLDGRDPRPISEGRERYAGAPQFSPDGQWLLYNLVDVSIRGCPRWLGVFTMRLDGSERRPVVPYFADPWLPGAEHDVLRPVGVAWGPAGVVIQAWEAPAGAGGDWVARARPALWLYSPTGVRIRKLLGGDEGERAPRGFALGPDGHHVAWVEGSRDQTRVMVARIGGGETRTVAGSTSSASSASLAWGF